MALLASALTVTALPAAVAAPAAATPQGGNLSDDFNGDGYADLTVAAPDASVDGKAKAGYVAVMYGSANGLRTDSKQVVTQNTPGVTDSAETADRFGSAVGTADLDRDGYAETGLVQVVWGGPRGLSGGAALAYGRHGYDRLSDHGHLTLGDTDGDGATDLVLVTEDSKLRVVKGPFGRDGSAGGGERTILGGTDIRFLDLATGDLDRDGFDDVVGTVHDGDEYDSRRVIYWRGTPDGLTTGTAVVDGHGMRIEAGESVGVGDVNGDGYADIVVGRPTDGYDSDRETPMSKGGRVAFVPGSAKGPVAAKAMFVNQDSAGVPGAAEDGDSFGTDISVGDVDGDGYADVATGVPGESMNGSTSAGATIVLRGGAGGLTGAGAQGVNQDTEHVPGAVESDDVFGTATRLLDTDGDGRAELTVGAPGENAHAGSVWVFRSTSSGITPTGSRTFGAATLGTVAAEARLGSGFRY